ncbi:hypothetical protein HanIR_Chr16g0832441 [Helianthus annuus]|nr:hypothetical protein HanIR_Chr16g0832441 [Helianthus annuus]
MIVPVGTILPVVGTIVSYLAVCYICSFLLHYAPKSFILPPAENLYMYFHKQLK